MADKQVNSSIGVSENFKDSGDGTFARVMATYAVGTSTNTAVQRVSAGFMAPGQTAKQYVGKATTSTTLTTTITLETVTAGKTFYITDLSLFTNSSTAIDGSIQAAAVPIYVFGTSTTAPVQMAGMETQPYATTGQVVTLVLPSTTAVQTVWYNISGFEQ